MPPSAVMSMRLRSSTKATVSSLSHASPHHEDDRQATASAAHKEQSKPDDSSQYRFSVATILASAFLNLLGFTMAGPITPALGQHFSLAIGATFGSLTSAYPLGMLVGLFLWPQLSDRIGRKPVMVASLLGSGLGLAAQAYAIQAGWSLRIFLLTRVFTGSFAGSSPVSKAFLADVGASRGKLPRYLALRDAASTMAFIVGPMLGGMLFDARRKLLHATTTTPSLSFVIGITATASLAAALLTAVFVREVPPQQIRTTTSSQQQDSNQTYSDSTTVIVCPLGVSLWAGVATICIVSFLFNVGDSTFHAFFPSLLRERLGLDTRTIGLAYTALATLSLTSSITLAGRAVQFLGPVTTCAIGLSAISGGLLALGVVTTHNSPMVYLAAAALYYVGVPLYGPTIPTMLLRCVPPSRRGAIMGLDGAINTIGRVIAPLVMGDLYRRSGPTAAFGLAGMAVMSAAIMALVRRVMVVRDRRDFVVAKEA
jgi:MFS transporter, DHA1 family, tetracycline resistance protein